MQGSNQVSVNWSLRGESHWNCAQHKPGPRHLWAGLGVDTLGRKHSQWVAARQTEGEVLFFILWNAAAESSCHCWVYFYLKPSPGSLYSAPIFLLQSSNSFIITVRKQLCITPVLVFTGGCFTTAIFFPQYKSVKQASARVVSCYLNPPVTLWLNAPAALRHCKHSWQTFMLLSSTDAPPHVHVKTPFFICPIFVY